MEDRERYMQQEDPFLDWLEKHRTEMSEIIKDMTPEEICEFYDKRTEPIIKEFNLKLSPMKPVKPRRISSAVSNAADEARAAV